MTGDIVLGQYFPGNSFLHKLDPRTKIISSIILMIALFISWSYESLALSTLFTILVIAFSRVPLKIYLKSLKMVLIITLFSSFINIFYGVGEPIIHIGFMEITQDGINNSIFVMLRILNLMLISSAFMFTTSPNDMTYGLERLMKPIQRLNINVSDIIMMMTIALRFIPTIIEETQRITDAQKSRGADMNNKNLLKKIKSFVPVLIPLFISSFRRAYDLALAMECRCYNGSVTRTRMKELRIRTYDIIAYIAVLSVTVGVITCNILKK